MQADCAGVEKKLRQRRLALLAFENGTIVSCSRMRAQGQHD
jgi:hypothetical protein